MSKPTIFQVQIYTFLIEIAIRDIDLLVIANLVYQD